MELSGEIVEIGSTAKKKRSQELFNIQFVCMWWCMSKVSAKISVAVNLAILGSNKLGL